MRSWKIVGACWQNQIWFLYLNNSLSLICWFISSTWKLLTVGIKSLSNFILNIQQQSSYNTLYFPFFNCSNFVYSNTWLRNFKGAVAQWYSQCASVLRSLIQPQQLAMVAGKWQNLLLFLNEIIYWTFFKQHEGLG